MADEAQAGGESRVVKMRDPASAAVRVSVVIPTLNEARNLPPLFNRLPVGLHEIIIVDGHSTDGTVAVAQALYPEIRIVLQNAEARFL